MSPIEKLKVEAVALQARTKSVGRALKHSAALEQIAKINGFSSWRACKATLEARQLNAKPAGEIAEMKRYESKEWHFALDIPRRWNRFPAVPTNSPNEVTRFASKEEGVHLLIIFRNPWDPQSSLLEHSGKVQADLAKNGFGNFSNAETTIGPRPALILNFDRTQGNGLWRCRHYFLMEGTLGYTLGFGSNQWDHVAKLYDEMAKSFEIFPEPPS